MSATVIKTATPFSSFLVTPIRVLIQLKGVTDQQIALIVRTSETAIVFQVPHGHYLIANSKGTYSTICQDVWNKKWNQPICSTSLRTLNTTGLVQNMEVYTVNIKFLNKPIFKIDYLTRGNCASGQLVSLQCLKNSCGLPVSLNPHRATSFIVGRTQVAAPGAWPWLSVVRYLGRYQCSASVLADRWLVSAAHCFYSVYGRPLSELTHYFSFLLGINDRMNVESGLLVKAAKVYINPGYRVSDGPTSQHDIALIELREKLTFDNLVKPICLPLPANDHHRVDCRLAAWGRYNRYSGTQSRYLREVRLRVWDDKRCDVVWNKFNSSLQLCAGLIKTAACNGDSGAPLMCKRSDRWVIEGVLSYGDGSCAGANYHVTRPTVFTSISAHSDWIRKTIESVS